MAFSTLVTDLNSPKPSAEVCDQMEAYGFRWSTVSKRFESGGKLYGMTDGRYVTPYLDQVSRRSVWQWICWAKGTLAGRGEGFDSPITAYVNAELAGWE